MGRPIKQGLDYFPLDVVLDTKFELIEAEFGVTGFAVIVKLFQRIYGEQGYYCEWKSEVALLFAHRTGLGCNVVSEIVDAAVKRGIFDKEKFEKYGVLTSKGIQNRFLEAKRSTDVSKIKSEYLLIGVPKNEVSAAKTQVSAAKTLVNATEMPQSKGKESKGKESKELLGDDVPKQPKNFIQPTVEEVTEYCRERNNRVDPQKFIDYYTARGWQLSKGVKMKDWKACVRTWERNEHQPEQSSNGTYTIKHGDSKNTFNNYTQKIYSNDELMRRAEEKNRKRREAQ